jgi:type I restriction enzyme M protein
MLDTLTKRRIDTARDILVGKLPDPKSQVEQITIALIYKFMDDMDKQSEELGGKSKFFTGEYEKYSWSKIFDPRVSGFELVNLYGEALQRMNQNPNIPQLFRNIFKNAYLPYRDPETLKMFLKIIGEFEYDYSEKLGDAFEYLLSIMGSQGDAGQFRTPRHIIDFIVKVVDPSKNETILDPACGTAGFLISSFTHIGNKSKKDGRINLTPDERARLIENLSGYDISPDMVRLSLVNMYLHGFQSPKIYEYDTLTSEEKWNEFYDIILANPPFMSPKGGIRPHKRFSVQANRSEVLFVDYIEEHLNPNGRAGVIVPEGIIFQSGIAYKKLRKMLIENSLYAVVSLPAGVFNPYSGVKTSILFLNKNLAKKTDKILFVKVNNDGFGLGAQRREIKENDLPLALEIINKYKQRIIENKEIEFNLNEAKYAYVVKKEKIAESGDYNLIGDRYKQAVIHSGKWDFVEIKNICELGRGRVISNKYIEEHLGKYPVYSSQTQNKGIFGYINTYDFDGEYATWTTDGANAGTVFYRKGKFNCTNVCGTLKAKSRKINMKYLASVLHHVAYKYVIQLGNPKLMNNVMAKIKIPLPPLEIQEQIVAELGSYQKIIDGARQVVENYKPTFKIDPEWEIMEIGEMCNLMTGGTPKSTVKEYYGGNIKWIVSGDVHLGEIFDCPNRITQKGLENSNAKYLPIDSVLIALNGQGKTRGTVALLKTKATCNQSIVSILPKDKSKLISEYLYAILKIMYVQIRNLTGDIQRSGLNMSLIKKIKIPFPPLEIQKQIVARIENEQKAINSNKELITIFENKIKEKIAEVWGE